MPRRTGVFRCLLLALAVALPAAAQYVPEVSYPVRQDVSPPVRELFGIPIVELQNRAPMPLPLKGAAPQFDPVLQSTPGTAANTSPGVNFDGVGIGAPGCNCAPPDTNMAVGPNHILQWVNTAWAVYDKVGNIQPGFPKAGNSFWTGFGGDCETHNDGDPIAQYDKAADRWMVTQFAVNLPFGQNSECIAVSVTSDPGGAYFRYQYNQPFMNDYPKATVWPVAYTGAAQGAYFFSYNMFQFGAFFQGGRACAYDRSKMLIGAAATEVCFQGDTSVGSILPSDLDGATLPLAGTPNFYFDFGTNELLMWKFTPNFVTPGSSTFTGPTHIPVAAFSIACGGGTCIPQSETTQQLDALSDRLMYRNSYRNFGDHEAVIINHSVTAGSGVGARWYEIRSPNAPTVYQQATFAPDSGYRWMGSVATDQNGNIALGYSTSSGSMHPAIRVTGREPADPLGTMQSEESILEGGGSQASGLSRWGDYSAMRIDPADDCTFWYTTEYIPANGTFNWKTRIASFKFNSCGGPPPPPPLPPTALTATAVSAHQIDLAWTDNSSDESGFKIERCQGTAVFCDLNPGNFAQIAQVGANVTAYSNTGLAASTTYAYRVRAFNSGGNSLYSNTADATTFAPSPPAGPSNLTAAAVSASQINLNWTDNSNNEDGFKIERCQGSGCSSFAEIAQVGANVTSYNNTGLNSQTSYSYRVRAFNIDGNSGYSNTASATTQQLAAPSNLTATPGRAKGKAFVDLSWTDNSSSETNFDIERCTGAGCTSFGALASVGANVTTYRDNTAARRTTYQYRVKARDAGGSSGYSNTASATTN